MSNASLERYLNDINFTRRFRENNFIVGSGTVVTKFFPENNIFGSNPAIVIKTRK